MPSDWLAAAPLDSAAEVEWFDVEAGEAAAESADGGEPLAASCTPSGIGIIGADDRRAVADPLEVPCRWICQLRVRRRDSNGRTTLTGATGLLVSPRHVLTAAHPIRVDRRDERGQWVSYDATDVWVSPARAGGSRPLGTWAAALPARLAPRWQPRGGSAEFDYALLTLERPVGDREIPRLGGRLCYWGATSCGHQAVAYRLPPEDLEGATAITAGYPADRGGGTRLMMATGRLSGVVATRRLMNFAADACQGQSGSPVWIGRGGEHRLAGLLVKVVRGHALAIRITRELSRQLRQWLGAESDGFREPSPAVGTATVVGGGRAGGAEAAAEQSESVSFEPALEAMEEAFRVSPNFDPRTLDPRPEQQTGGAGAPVCYDVTAPSVAPAIGFEFDLSYGASAAMPPPPAPDYALEGKRITTHSEASDGFRLKGDGNRIEISTKPFELTDAGKVELDRVMGSVLAWVERTVTACQAAKPDRSLRYPARVGPPRAFAPGDLAPDAKCIFPLGFTGTPYYRSSCAVAASPQATLTLPLARIDELVQRIETSERSKVPGRAWSGPSTDRMGDRSTALYDARAAVNASRASHLGRSTLRDGTPVTEANYSATLQGLLILVVSYLRAGELRYDRRDWEAFAKGYLPLNVKHPFRLPFADLNAGEKAVFRELYTGPRTKLWRLARAGATLDDGNRVLFPPKSHAHQLRHFDPPPTWNDLVDSMLANAPMKRNVDGVRCKSKEGLGCELLVAPCSSIIPYEPGSRRVTVEMRRIGFQWVFSHPVTFAGVRQPGWLAMTRELFAMARDLNR